MILNIVLESILNESKDDLSEEEKKQLLKRSRGSYWKSAALGAGGGYIGGGILGGVAGGVAGGIVGHDIGKAVSDKMNIDPNIIAKSREYGIKGGAASGFLAGANLIAPLGLGAGVVKNGMHNIGARTAKADKEIKHPIIKGTLAGGAAGVGVALTNSLKNGVQSKRQLAADLLSGGMRGMIAGNYAGRSYAKGVKKYNDEKDYYLKAKHRK